jgi:uncharacterized membrane protein YhaH (DUF805 family)
MNFQQSIEKCLKNYANFKGRATRSEYWFFILFTILVSFVGTIFDLILFASAAEFSPINSIVTLALITPQLSAGCRRLHDIGKSGWWQLLYLTIIGGLVLLIWFVFETNKRKNQFGPVPKK